MKKIPCKQCKNCGKYSSINITQCRCGADLTELPGAAVEHNRIPLPQIGRIDKDLRFYVRKCPVCNTEHFFTEPGGAVRRCRNCSKSQIQYQPTIPYEDEEEKKEIPQPEVKLPVSPLVTGGWDAEDDDEDEEDDLPGGSLYDVLRKNIRQSTGTTPGAVPPADKDEDDDEDEDEDSPGLWGELLGKKGLSPEASSIRRNRINTPETAQPKKPEPASQPPVKPGVSTLTITALRYGTMTLTLRSDSAELPYLLGRSAGCAEFLRQDAQVGNEHCWLDYRNGTWMVIEKRAINGTAVNQQFLPEGGREKLRDGDELMLGHRIDSMAFRVRIR